MAVRGTAGPAKRREEYTLLAAALANGPAELLDFVLPLWAGAALGASPTTVGLLVAVELAVSVVARPVAGVLADARERRWVAAAGALLYAASCAGYAVAGSVAVAYVAAVLGGLGGALFWVSVRAITGERLAEDPAVYPRLMSAQETGSWIAFVVGLILLGVIDFGGVFLVCAGSCLAAAAALISAPSLRGAGEEAGRGTGEDAGRLGLGRIGRRLRPMLLAVAVTIAAESAVGLLLLLHLQRDFDLGIVEIAYVFLPGAIAMSVLPEYLHGLVTRFGRVRVLAAGSVSSAAFAASLAWAPNPVVIAGLWVLSGVAWAAVLPIQQAVVAEASGERLGRGMGLYESAALLGGLVGAAAAGVLYDSSSWTVACLVAAAVILSGAVLVPRSVRALGVADVPTPVASGREPLSDPHQREPTAPDPAPAPDPEPRPASEPATAPEPQRSTPKSARQRMRELGEHALLYIGAQSVLAWFGLSWPVNLITGSRRDLDGFAAFAHGAGRIWTFILVIDVLWTLGEVAGRGRRTGPAR